MLCFLCSTNQFNSIVVHMHWYECMFCEIQLLFWITGDWDHRNQFAHQKSCFDWLKIIYLDWNSLTFCANIYSAEPNKAVNGNYSSKNMLCEQRNFFILCVEFVLLETKIWTKKIHYHRISFTCNVLASLEKCV